MRDMSDERKRDMDKEEKAVCRENGLQAIYLTRYFGSVS